MDIQNTKYNSFHLVNEMFAAVSMIRNFDQSMVDDLLTVARNSSNWMITGEGSSRFFPGKNLLYHRMLLSEGPAVFVQDATLLKQYNLNDFVVFGASNSGRTKELVTLFQKLHHEEHKQLLAISCNKNSPLESLTAQILYANFCPEKAVAASYSVMAQALVYDALLFRMLNQFIDLEQLAQVVNEALEVSVSEYVIEALAGAKTIYIAGNDNGVAEELTLKSMEMIRKPSVYLPGTLLLHGVEEVISSDDVILIIDELPDDVKKISEVYAQNIGAKVILIGQEQEHCLSVSLPNIENQFFEGYAKLALGWNILASTGIGLGVNIDLPQRARKVGNEITA